MKFKVGDRVKIKSTSRYYVDDDPYNPKGVAGEVINKYDWDILSLRVLWPSGLKNSYNHSDLEIAEEVGTLEELGAVFGETFELVDCPYDLPPKGSLYKVEDGPFGVQAYRVTNCTKGLFVKLNCDWKFKRVEYEDKWHLNEGQEIPEGADTLEKDGSVVAYRLPKKEPEVTTKTFDCHYDELYGLVYGMEANPNEPREHPIKVTLTFKDGVPVDIKAELVK